MKKNETLNPEEKLDLVRTLITESREEIERGGGRIFLLWGYLSLIVTLAVLILIDGYQAFWAFNLFWIIPIVGYPSMIFCFRKKKKVTTFVDRFVLSIWIVTGLVCALFPLLSLIDGTISKIIPQVESMVIGMGVMMTGLAVKSKPVAMGGLVAILLSLSMYITNGYDMMIYTYIAVFIFGLIIPGHILNYQTRNR